jgi:hypothetical protein
MARLLRSTCVAFALWAGIAANVLAQAPPLVFTVGAPERTTPETIAQTFVVVEERGLALWSGAASDFGAGVSLAGSRWTIRSVASMTMLPYDGSHNRPSFQQFEVVKSMLGTGSLSVGGGGGIRQEWDGTPVLIGRVLAGADMARGRLQGSLVVERAVASPIRTDAADIVTSLGWSRRVGDRIAFGVEGIGQDLEGLWNPAEADGGAKLLVGPSLHVQSKTGDWAASLTAGPVIRTVSTLSPPGMPATTDPRSGHHFGMFASATWAPSLRR